jgi:hypothetical protein
MAILQPPTERISEELTRLRSVIFSTSCSMGSHVGAGLRKPSDSNHTSGTGPPQQAEGEKTNPAEAGSV